MTTFADQNPFAPLAPPFSAIYVTNGGKVLLHFDSNPDAVEGAQDFVGAINRELETSEMEKFPMIWNQDHVPLELVEAVRDLSLDGSDSDFVLITLGNVQVVWNRLVFKKKWVV